MDLKASSMHARGSAHSTPKWVKMFAIGAVILLLLLAAHLIVMRLLDRSIIEHSGHALSSGITEHALQRR
jgi:hypothetical protein